MVGVFPKNGPALRFSKEAADVISCPSRTLACASSLEQIQPDVLYTVPSMYTL